MIVDLTALGEHGMVGTIAADQLEGGPVAVEDDDRRRGQGLERPDTDMAEPGAPMASAVVLGVSRILAITS